MPICCLGDDAYRVCRPRQLGVSPQSPLEAVKAAYKAAALLKWANPPIPFASPPGILSPSCTSHPPSILSFGKSTIVRPFADYDTHSLSHTLSLTQESNGRHPDKNPDDREKATEEFQKLGRAYEVLQEPPRATPKSNRGNFPGFSRKCECPDCVEANYREFLAKVGRIVHDLPHHGTSFL